MVAGVHKGSSHLSVMGWNPHKKPDEGQEDICCLRAMIIAPFSIIDALYHRRRQKRMGPFIFSLSWRQRESVPFIEKHEEKAQNGLTFPLLHISKFIGREANFEHYRPERFRKLRKEYRIRRVLE